MGLLFCIFLIVLGVMGADTLIAAKAPAAKPAIARLLQYQEAIGVIGLMLGFISLFLWLLSAHSIFAHPFHIVISLIALLLELGLGLIFGLSYLRRSVFKDPASPILANLTVARERILPRQQEMGIAAIIVGVICFFALFF